MMTHHDDRKKSVVFTKSDLSERKEVCIMEARLAVEGENEILMPEEPQTTT
jgi:hypothetical protein